MLGWIISCGAGIVLVWVFTYSLCVIARMADDQTEAMLANEPCPECKAKGAHLRGCGRRL